MISGWTVVSTLQLNTLEFDDPMPDAGVLAHSLNAVEIKAASYTLTRIPDVMLLQWRCYWQGACTNALHANLVSVCLPALCVGLFVDSALAYTSTH